MLVVIIFFVILSLLTAYLFLLSIEMMTGRRAFERFRSYGDSFILRRKQSLVIMQEKLSAPLLKYLRTFNNEIVHPSITAPLSRVWRKVCIMRTGGRARGYGDIITAHGKRSPYLRKLFKYTKSDKKQNNHKEV